MEPRLSFVLSLLRDMKQHPSSSYKERAQRTAISRPWVEKITHFLAEKNLIHKSDGATRQRLQIRMTRKGTQCISCLEKTKHLFS